MASLLFYQKMLYLVSSGFVFVAMAFLLRRISDYIDEMREFEEEDSVFVGVETLTIVDIKQTTPTVKTFRLSLGNKLRFPEFCAGQFLSFHIPGLSEEIIRSYSICSSDVNHAILDISVKLIPEGLGSGWFHSREVGDTVEAYPANGLFNLSHLGPSDPVILVAGGIGLTPILSIVKSEIDRCTGRDITLFYGALNLQEIAFHKELENYSLTNKNFKYIPVLSEEESGWSGQTGRIGLNEIKSVASDLSLYSYFLCGPPPMSNAIIEALIGENVKESRIYFEKFISPQSIKIEDLDVRQAKIEFGGDSYSYDAKGSILDFLNSKGANIAYSCKSGVCGTCKCKLSSGEIKSLTDTGISDHEKSLGFFLPCVSFPDGDIKVEEDK